MYPKPPFEELKKDNGSLKRDKLKFEEILRRFEERRQKWLRQVQDEKTELEYNRAYPSPLFQTCVLILYNKWAIWREYVRKRSDSWASSRNRTSHRRRFCA